MALDHHVIQHACTARHRALPAALLAKRMQETAGVTGSTSLKEQDITTTEWHATQHRPSTRREGSCTACWCSGLQSLSIGLSLSICVLTCMVQSVCSLGQPAQAQQQTLVHHATCGASTTATEAVQPGPAGPPPSCSHRTASATPCHISSCLGTSRLGHHQAAATALPPQFASHLFSPECVPTQVHLQMREAGAPSHPPRRGRHPSARSTQTRAAPGGAPEGRGRSGDAPSAKGQASPAAHTCNRSGALFATRSAIHWGCLNAGQVLTKGFSLGCQPMGRRTPFEPLTW